MKPAAKRTTVLSLLKSGKITAGEAVTLSGASRQLLYYWMNTEKIDWRKARKQHVTKVWKQSQLKELMEI